MLAVERLSALCYNENIQGIATLAVSKGREQLAVS